MKSNSFESLQFFFFLLFFFLKLPQSFAEDLSASFSFVSSLANFMIIGSFMFFFISFRSYHPYFWL